MQSLYSKAPADSASVGYGVNIILNFYYRIVILIC